MISAVLEIVIVSVIVKQAIGDDMFSAISHIEPLLNAHKSIIANVEEYLSQEKQRLAVVRNVLSHYKIKYKEMEGDLDYIKNPMNAFTLKDKLTADLQYIDFFANDAQTTFNKDVNLPTMKDLKGAGSALLRIQNTYKLNVTQLSQGVIQGTYSHGNKPYFEKVLPITSSDLFELGKRAYMEQDFENAIAWLTEALRKYRPKDDMINFVEADLIDWLRESYHWLGDFDNALTWTEKLLTLESDHEKARQRVAEYKNLLVEYGQLKDSQKIKDNPYLKPVDENLQIYYDLCRGEQLLPNIVTKILYCYYKSGPEPFLKLARIKAELIHHDPAVLMFHDVISDAEVQVLQYLSRDKLERSEVQQDNVTASKVSYRVSKTAWFEDRESPVVARISQRVADFTDLSVETAELLQVANYGIGGHYEAHFDFLDKGDYTVEQGNRIASVVFYMSDVEQGGATTFTEFGLTVFPTKNSAIFWMNLLPSGEPDKRTTHGACPVLRGSKWVCIKWLHAGGQEFRRRCPVGFQNKLSF